MTDNFFRFWYSFGFVNFSQLEDGDVDGVYDYLVEPNLHEFASFTFEDICLEFVKKLQKENALPFRYSKLGRWTGKTTLRDSQYPNGLRTAETEIDILGINSDANKYLVCECKFKASKFNYTEYLNTLAKLAPLKAKSEFYYFLFSESGFDDKIVEETSENLRLYGLEEIVSHQSKSE